MKLAKMIKPKNDKTQTQLDADFEDFLGLEQSLGDISFEKKEDYRNFIQKFVLKINTFQKSPFYCDFIDELLKNFTDNCKLIYFF